jgi:8-oxo-dGTP diphosphatase
MADAPDPSTYDPMAFPPFAVTVDIAVFTLVDKPVPPKSGRAPRKELAAVLIVRGGDTEAGRYALPGGFVHEDEDLPEAAMRELQEEAGLELPESAIHQFGVYGKPKRDPRMRVVTIAFAALTSIDVFLEAGTDATAVEIVPVRRIFDGEISLAFDHEQILRDAHRFVSGLIEETSAALELCPETFTITELRHVCEAVWGYEVDRATFNKRVLLIDGFLEPDDSDEDSWWEEESNLERLSDFPLSPSPLESSSPREDLADSDFNSRADEGVLGAMSLPSSMRAQRKSSTRGRPAQKYRRGTADTLHPPLLRPRAVLKKTDSWFEKLSVKSLIADEKSEITDNEK